MLISCWSLTVEADGFDIVISVKFCELDNIRLTWSWLQGKSYEVVQIVKLESKIFPTLNMIYTTQWLIQHEEIKVSNVEDEKLDGQTSIKDFHIATIYKLPR